MARLLVKSSAVPAYDEATGTYTMAKIAVGGSVSGNDLFRVTGNRSMFASNSNEFAIGLKYVIGDSAGFYLGSTSAGATLNISSLGGGTLTTMLQSGSWTWGVLSAGANYSAVKHFISGGLHAANVTSADGSGRLVIGVNSYRFGNTSDNARIDTTSGGMGILLNNRTSNANPGLEIYASQPGQGLTVSSVIMSATHDGIFTFGPATGASGTLEHTFQSSSGNTYVSIKPVAAAGLGGILLYGNSLPKWTILNNAAAAHELEIRDSANNVAYLINQSGNSTIGRPSLVSDTFHIVRGNCGIAFTNLSGAVGIGSNLNHATTRNFNRASTTGNGGAIVFDANTSAAQSAISIFVQPPGGSVGGTTGAIQAGGLNGLGEWNFGTANEVVNVVHVFNGPRGNASGDYKHTTLRVQGASGQNSLSVVAAGSNGISYTALILDRSFADSFLWFSQSVTNRFRFVTTTNDTWFTSGAGLPEQAGYAELGSISKTGEWGLAASGSGQAHKVWGNSLELISQASTTGFLAFSKASSGVRYGKIGHTHAANDIITGATASDMCFSTFSGLSFSGNDGSNLDARFSHDGCYLGSPTGTSTQVHVMYNLTTTLASQVCQFRKGANDTTTANVFIAFLQNGGGTGSGQINANGSNAAAFGTFSDIRLKKNIENIPSQLGNVMALRPVEFDYIDESGHQTGFIAQEMQQIYPDAVAVSDNEMLTVTGWDKTTARLVKAIQELSAKNDALEARLAAIES